ncbi:MAG: YjjG family noncanonical pyrimidine nucleotidase [Anaerolineae bacterium]|nr:YjjG family noncanonical pyrimidine nucleotidase [Anaerolineae bacterium]
MKYSWILFDADGTLFDYDRAEGVALESAFAEMELAFQPGYTPIYREINEAIWKAFERGEIARARLRLERFERLFEAAGVRVDAAAFSAVYLRHLGDGAFLIDGALQVIAALRGKIHLALITNGLKEVQRSRLARSAISDAFEAVIISEEVGVSKPDVRIFDIAFEQMGRPARSKVLLVGDSLTSDMAGGIAYSIDTCWFNPAGQERTLQVSYEIQDLWQVVALAGL